MRPTPIIMFSAHTKRGARETFEALVAGAVDFCTKPRGEVSTDLKTIANELTSKLRVAAGANPKILSQASKPIPRPPSPEPQKGHSLVIIAISTGGPAALSKIVPVFPIDMRASVIVVQHMPAQFTAALAERLDAQSAVGVCEATNGDAPKPGIVYIAPGDKHLAFDSQGRFLVTQDPPINGCRPAADKTMSTAAKYFGRRCVGLVMTGMGRDGANGMAAIKDAKGQTWAQDKETSVIFGMPKAAIDAGVVDDVLPLAEIPIKLRYL